MSDRPRPKSRALALVRVLPRPGAPSRGLLIAGPLVLPCALGRAGVRASKREGDGATPAGILHPGLAYRRADRVRRVPTVLRARLTRAEDGWCDDPRARSYDRPVRLPAPHGHEVMARADGLYDLVVELRRFPARTPRGRGSAIFLHVAPPGPGGRGFGVTAGCIALPLPALAGLLIRLGPGTRFVVGQVTARRGPRVA